MKTGAGLQRGVTLIELLAFIVIIMVAAVALLGSYRSILPRSPTPAQITMATQLAQERMEIIVGQKAILGFSSTNLDPCNRVPAGTPPAICTPLSGFTVTPTGHNALVAWQGNPTSSYRQITVTVTGPGNINLQYDTVLSNY